MAPRKGEDRTSVETAKPHHHSHTRHSHPHSRASDRIRWALALTFGFAIIELAGGLWAGSLALVSDAGHMFSDSGALGLAAFAAWVARHPPSARHSFGLVRAEVITALANAVIMLVVITVIVVEAVERLRAPQPVSGGAVMLIALGGLMVNVGAALVLSGGGHDINTRGALLHVMGDLLGSFAALLAGAVIFFSGWLPIDPILSLVVAALILFSALRLLREALHVLMEGVPFHLDLEHVGREMAELEGVVSVHDLHIWTLSSGMIALSAHVELEDIGHWPRTLDALRKMLRDRHHIDHVTLQPELAVKLVQPYQAAIPIYPTK
jgi:cobalt-zinc-cadmium efflux system protein